MNAIAQLVLSDLGPLAFSVLALLFFSSISVWIVFLLKTLSLIRGLYLQKKAIKLLERIPRQEELRLRFAAMPRPGCTPGGERKTIFGTDMN